MTRQQLALALGQWKESTKNCREKQANTERSKGRGANRMLVASRAGNGHLRKTGAGVDGVRKGKELENSLPGCRASCAGARHSS